MIAQKRNAFKAKVNLLAHDELLVKLARGGLAALLIKIGAAGLSFLMFLALARAMTPEDFGRFGFAFSLATILAVLGSFGQRALVMRFASIYHQEGKQSLLRGVIRSGYRLVILGCGTLGVATACFGWFWHGLEHRSYYLATGVFILILGLAEYQAHLLRAFGGMTLALLPRDILWRAGVIVFVGLSAFSILPLFNITQSIWLVAGILAGTTLGQALYHPATHPKTVIKKGATYETRLWRKASLGLWGTSVVQMAAPNLAVVILGVMLSPSETGPFFAALRLAMLLNLFLMASSMVSSPLISVKYKSNDIDGVQRLCSIISLGVTIPTLFGFIGFIFLGRYMLELFGHGFSSAYIPLLILSAGYLIHALSGPTAQIMEMTGNERVYLKIILGTNLTVILLMSALIYKFGIIGAAIGVTSALSVWNILIVFWIRKNLNIDPSIQALNSLGN